MTVRFGILILASSMVLGGPALAATTGGVAESGGTGAPTTGAGAMADMSQAEPSSTDALFAALAAARDEAEARDIETKIRAGWIKAGGDTMTLLMSRAMDALFSGDYALALDILDAVVALDPNFAEGWSQRATLHYLEGDYGKALVELEHTLALEPRHFGALSDTGLILKALGDKAGAVDFLERALALHPFLDEAGKALKELLPEVRGREI